MRVFIIAATPALLLSTAAGPSSAAIQNAARPGSQSAVELVEVVGCLAEESGNTWVLTNATEPVASKAPSTTTASLKEAAERPLGQQRFRLLGVSFFKPDASKGHKVAAKGVLIKGSQPARLNVTSLQSVAPGCDK